MKNYENVKFYAKGLSFYSHTNKPETKGKYASNKYGVGLKDFEFNTKDDELVKFINDNFVRENKDGIEFIKSNNSIYPITVYDKNNKRFDESIPLSNDTMIYVSFSIKINPQSMKPYLIVNGVKLTEDYKPYNAFDDMGGDF